MTVLYFVLLVCSAAFGIYFSAWRPRFVLGFAALHNT